MNNQHVDQIHQSAFEIALNAGWLYLTGDKLAAEGYLTPRLAVVAGGPLLKMLQGAIASATKLPQAIADADDETERDDIACHALEVRMDAWACYYALMEVETATECRTLAYVTSHACELMERLDAELRKHVGILSRVAHTRLLDNWRTMLAEEFRGWPWWLDGTLEAGLKKS